MTKPLAPEMPHHSDLKTPADIVLDQGGSHETSRRQMLHWMVAGAAGTLVLGSASTARAQSVEEKVKQIITSTLGVEESEVKYETSFTDDLGADSLDTVELVMKTEKSFGVVIPDDTAARLLTVADLIHYVEEHQ